MAAGSKKKAKVIEGSVVETPEPEFESASSAETFAAAPVAETIAAAPVAAVAETFATAPVTAIAETFSAAPVTAIAETFSAAPVAAVAETIAAAPVAAVAETIAAAPVAAVAEAFAAAPVAAVAETFSAAPVAAVAETIAAAPVAALAEAPKLEGLPAASLGARQERVRSLIETGISESRAGYARVKSAADEAAQALEASCSSAQHGAVEISVEALEALRATADANFDFAKSALKAKTASEYIALHRQFARKQIEMLASQTKAMGVLAQKVAAETIEPIKAQVVKTLRLPS